MSDAAHSIRLTVNERTYERPVEPRLLLSDFLRHDLGLTGTHVGCEHGVCGACTVLLDGVPVRSCLMLAVQANDHVITTVEGLASGPEALHPLQPRESVGFREKRQHLRFAGVKRSLQLLKVAGECQLARAKHFGQARRTNPLSGIRHPLQPCPACMVSAASFTACTMC